MGSKKDVTVSATQGVGVDHDDHFRQVKMRKEGRERKKNPRKRVM
jgi:hypothetical protein